MDRKALRYRFPAVLVIGSEKRGLSYQLLEAADFMVRIPMCRVCSSLNAAVGREFCRRSQCYAVHGNRVAAKLAIEYGFTDIDGKVPRPLTLADV